VTRARSKAAPASPLDADTIVGFAQACEALDVAALERIRLELDDEAIDANEAMREAQAEKAAGNPVSPSEWADLVAAQSFCGRRANWLAHHIGQRRRAEVVAESRSYAQRFIDSAKAILDHATFQRIVDAAKERA